MLLIASITGLQHLYLPISAAGVTALLAVLAFYVIQRLGFFRLNYGPDFASKRHFLNGIRSPEEARRLTKHCAPFTPGARLYWSIACCGLSPWFIASLETWIALFALGVHASFLTAGIVEIIGQGVRTVLFIVPAGLGVFEGGMVMVCGLLGIPGDIALALSLIRRGREALFTVPGLIVWQIIEGRRLFRGSKVNESEEILRS